ncbi:MAG: PhoH family protein, partial [Gammaproteobacteria bacterium]
VVTGDVTQIDLPPGQLSGLVEAEQVLAGVEGVAICRFGEADVVRHPLVQRIVQAYEGDEELRGPPGGSGGAGGVGGVGGGGPR